MLQLAGSLQLPLTGLTHVTTGTATDQLTAASVVMVNGVPFPGTLFVRLIVKTRPSVGAVSVAST